MKLHRHASPLPSATSWYASCARAQGVAPKLEFQKRISKAAHHILASSAETKVALPGSTWGQPGVNLGSTWGRPGVNLGSTCSAPPGRHGEHGVAGTGEHEAGGVGHLHGQRLRHRRAVPPLLQIESKT